ncbi:MAG: SufD family Fe-S cluster assembly protein, partial [Bacteroidota bacterium]
MTELFIDQPNLEAQLGEFLRMTSQSLEGLPANPLHNRRREALAYFQNLGFPNTKHEEWKYTNVKPLINKAYAFGSRSEIQANDIQGFAIADLEANVLVMENGKYRPDLSKLLDSEDDLIIRDLHQVNQEHPELLEAFYSQKLNLKNEAFTALNTLMAEDGIFIHIPKNKVVQHPIMLHYISDAREKDVFITPRVLILVEENAEASLIDQLSTLGTQASFNNAITEIQVAPAARFNHYKIQNDQAHTYFIGTTQVHQGANSLYHNVTISLDGSLVRNNLNIQLDGQNIESNMYGLYMLEGKTLVDNHSIADHMQPHSVSNELYKGIMDGQSKGVFNGKIFVR